MIITQAFDGQDIISSTYTPSCSY